MRIPRGLCAACGGLNGCVRCGDELVSKRISAAQRESNTTGQCTMDHKDELLCWPNAYPELVVIQGILINPMMRGKRWPPLKRT